MHVQWRSPWLFSVISAVLLGHINAQSGAISTPSELVRCKPLISGSVWPSPASRAWVPCINEIRTLSNAQAQAVQGELASALSTGAPIVLSLGAGIFRLDQLVLLDLRTATSPIAVSISGQGANSTVLDCQGKAFTALLIKNAASTILSDLTVQNCGGDSLGAL